MGLLSYYGLIIVAFLALIIYDLLFFVTYKSDICPEIVPEPADEATADEAAADEAAAGGRLLNYLRELQDEAAADETAADETAADETQDEAGTPTGGLTENSLTVLPFILILLYVAIIVLCLIAMLGIYCFGGMSSERFGNLNICWACCGMYVRNFACLTRVLSILGLLLIGIQAILTYTNEGCQEAIHEYVVNRKIYKDEGAMYRASIMFVLVNLGFWGATHLLLPLIKLIIDSEAFLYEPYDREKSMAYYICCGVFGP